MHKKSSELRRVQRLWRTCRDDEKRAKEVDHRRLLEEFYDNMTFGPLLPFSDRDASSNVAMAQNYRELVKLLRQATSLEQKLRILAMWLRQERILEPTDFLSKRIRQGLVESTLKSLGMDPGVVKRSEFKYALVAEAWKPYFQLMHVENERAEREHPSSGRHKSQVLIGLGFARTAVNAALGSWEGLSSAREAACRFAAVRLGVGEETILVAHWKVYPSPDASARRRARRAAADATLAGS